jgi:hypothetical protein
MIGPANVEGSNPGVGNGNAVGRTTPGVIFQSGWEKGNPPAGVDGEIKLVVGVMGSKFWKNPAVDDVFKSVAPKTPEVAAVSDVVVPVADEAGN